MSRIIKNTIISQLTELSAIDPLVRIDQRIEKFSSMGIFQE